MSIQILQYEFLGPVPLSEWGPPMGNLLYIVLSKDKDRFNMLYAGDCEHTDDGAFFVQHKQFGCWVQRAGSESALHLAVLPMRGQDSSRRQAALKRILSNYRPPCNPVDMHEKRPSYNVRRADTADAGTGASGRDDSDADRGASGRDADSAGGPVARRGDDSQQRKAAGMRDDTSNSAENLEDNNAVSCPCCGTAMSHERDVGTRSALYRCGGCGMSDTRLT